MAGRRSALIVANDTYTDPGLAQLRAPSADAAALAEVLGDPSVGDFAVEVVRDGASYEVAARIEDLFATARPDDFLLVHFSCHGLKSDSGELFLAARDTRPDRLGSTAVAASFVQRCLRASRARSVVLLLDCCYGSAFGQGVAVRAGTDVNVLDSFPSERLGGGRSRAVITAASATEFSFEGDQLAEDRIPGPSVFTSAVVEGLRTGEADRDEDGFISVNELYDYVFDRVRAKSPLQTPGRDIEMHGELYVARSRRRRIRQEPIPRDLAAAVGDPNVFARLGAVAELRARITSPDLGVAAGALEVLREIARTDIQFVADAATQALGACALGLEPAAVTFGRVEQGSDPGVRSVALSGPPLARSVSVTTSERWLSADFTPDRLLFRVDTMIPGARRCAATVTGPTGAVDIWVDVEVVPRATDRTTSAATSPIAGGVLQASVGETPSTQADSPAPILPAGTPNRPLDPEGAPGRPMAPTSDRRPRPTGGPADWCFVRAGWSALLTAGLMISALALFLAQGQRDPGNLYILILASVIALAGGIIVRGRGVLPWVGSGALLGVGPNAIPGLSAVIRALRDGSNDASLWLVLVAFLTLVVAIVLGVVGLQRTPSVRRSSLRDRGLLSALLLLSGATCAAAIWVLGGKAWYLWLEVGTSLLAIACVVVVGVAAVVMPGLLAAAVLAGWVVGVLGYVAGFVVEANGFSPRWSAPLLVLLASLLALSALAVILGTRPDREVARPDREEGGSRTG